MFDKLFMSFCLFCSKAWLHDLQPTIPHILSSLSCLIFEKLMEKKNTVVVVRYIQYMQYDFDYHFIATCLFIYFHIFVYFLISSFLLSSLLEMKSIDYLRVPTMLGTKSFIIRRNFSIFFPKSVGLNFSVFHFCRYAKKNMNYFTYF